MVSPIHAAACAVRGLGAVAPFSGPGPRGLCVTASRPGSGFSLPTCACQAGLCLRVGWNKNACGGAMWFSEDREDTQLESDVALRGSQGPSV